MKNASGLTNKAFDTEEAMEETNKNVAPVVVTSIAPAKLTLAQVQAKLDGKTGRRFWKDLDSLAETDSFHELMAEGISSPVDGR